MGEFHQAKMAALGKMAAGLAHELNNPAAAAQRSAGQLVDALKLFAKASLQNDARFSAEERDRMHKLLIEAVKGRTAVCLLSPLARSDREAALGDWLEVRGLANPWNLTAIFLEAGITSERLDDFATGWSPATLTSALQWMDSSFSLMELAVDIEQSAGRISEVAKAMKEYAHMNQTALQVVDLNRCLDVTLIIFAHRLKSGIQVERQYDLELPPICAYVGELNQVWTNIFDNAVDAMQGKGILRVTTAREEGFVRVEIGDNGPGIPEDVLPHIFEAFFTTKPAGHGTGLGLDISFRIVTQRHHGTLSVESKPGDTRFVIRLPSVPAKECSTG